MAPYRVLIVDDSAFMRTIIGDLILRDKQFTIVATAVNGIEAVSAIARYKPDVVTMDLEMPIMNGLQALQHIMKTAPLPVIMLSGISEANTRDTIKALQYGAFDFIRKPSGPASGDIYQVGELLLEKMKAAVESIAGKNSSSAPKEKTTATAVVPPKRIPPPQEILPKAPLITRATLDTQDASETKKTYSAQKAMFQPMSSPSKPVAAQPAVDKPAPVAKVEITEPAPASKISAAQPGIVSNYGKKEETVLKKSIPNRPASGTFKHLVAIGTSTGGPRALHEVICSLPADFPAPVLVVQHMPPRFTKSLAQRLDGFSNLTVVEAEQGMRAAPGTVYIAPGGYHMELQRDSLGYWIHLGSQPQRNGHRPSVDVLYESLAPLTELTRHAVIMTGMGSDGAKGMKVLADSGAASTIAESEETCIVYGMPRSAIEAGFVQTVLPLQQIASRLVSAVSK